MKIRFLNLFIFFSLTVSSSAMEGDTLSTFQSVTENQARKQAFLKTSYLNPALHYFKSENSLSSISVQGVGDKLIQSNWVEEGEECNKFQVIAESFINLSSTSRVWGKAYYNRGKRKNVQWNETSDFELLYPYVAADTLGGDLTLETYFFNGGYTKKIKRWTVGAEFSYRAMLEFRKVDPRPKNSVANLQGKIGASYAVNNLYATALSIEGQKYKQNGTIKYYNELGVSKTYHLQGLGSSYVRFNGTRNQINYQGHLWKISADVLPVTQRGGWLTTLSYQTSFYEKILPSLNDLSLNELDEKVYQGRFGWISPLRRNQWGTQVEITHAKRTGTEMIYGDAAGNMYPLVAEQKGFERKELSGYLSAFWEKSPQAKWYYGGDFRVGYLSRKEKQVSSGNKMDFSELDLALLLTSTWKWKSDMLDARLQTSYRPNLDSKLLVKTVTHPFAEEVLRENFDHFSSDKVNYQLTLRWSHLFLQNKLAYLETSWAQQHETCSRNGHLWSATLGLIF